MNIITKKLNDIKTHTNDFVEWPDAEGIISKCFSIYQSRCFVVVKTNRRRRTIEEHQDNIEEYLEKFEIMKPALERLRQNGVHIPRFFGFFFDKSNNLYSVQLRMPGEGILPTPYGYERFASPTEKKLDKLLAAPEIHYKQFVTDICAIIDENIRIDFMNPTNFLYDEHYGFSFVDFEPVRGNKSPKINKDLVPHLLLTTFSKAFACEDNLNNPVIIEKYKKVFLRFVKALDTNELTEARRVGFSIFGENEKKFFKATDMRTALKQMFGKNYGVR